MIIKSLHLKNFRCFDDFGIEFNTGDGNHGGLTVLVARNGEGKTAILDAINIAWGLYFRKMPKTKGAFFHKEDRKNCDDAMAMASYGYTSLASSFITEHGDKSSIGIVRDCYLDKNGNARTSVKGGMGLDDYARTCLEKRFDNAFLLPLLAYYGEDRLWSEQLKEEESKAVLYQDRALGYSGANNRKSGFKTFYKWYVDLWKSLFDQKIKQMDDRVSFNIDAFRYYQTLNELLSNAVSDALNVTGWNQLDYDNGEKVLYVLNSITREKADIRSLSAGNRIVLGVVGDLVHRCSVLNPHAGMETLPRLLALCLSMKLNFTCILRGNNRFCLRFRESSRKSSSSSPHIVRRSSHLSPGNVSELSAMDRPCPPTPRLKEWKARIFWQESLGQIQRPRKTSMSRS